MSGINSGGGGGGGDVFQNGDNVFTGTNTFNVNLPTSSVTPTSGSQLITKSFADATYSTGTNTNDYVTGFSRNALTGAVTITQANTGTPITSESYTSITDAQINAIGTNTGNITTNASNISTNTGNITTNASNISTNASNISTNGTNISNLTTATNPCFKSASLTGQDLTLTPISGTATVISLPSGTGDAVLAGGTSGSRQIFTGFNTFTNDLTMSGAVGIGNRADIDMLGDKGFIKQSATVQNKLLQNGASNEIDQNGTNNIISQSGLNALITTSGKMTCATAPTSGSDLCNKTYVDGAAAAGFVSLTAGTAANPQEVTGVCDFKGGSLQMSNANQTFSMIQSNINTSDVNTLAMTGRRNRITQTGLSNALLNEFTQSGGANTASAISQFTPNSLIYQDTTTARIITKGRIGVGIAVNATPIAPLEIQGGQGSLQNTSNYGYLRNNNPPYGYSAGWASYTLSIKTSNIIFAGNYVLASDERIKRDITDLSSTLGLIDKIKPKTYKYRDTAEGDRMTYGFIAQELEQVIPEAVITTTDKIPNIMKKADVIDGVFILEETTDLVEGDLIAIYDDENKRYDVTITEMISDKSFKINMIEDLQDQFFIYGKIVDDFKAIEHNDLLPVMIKGIQELNERLAILEAKINNM